MNKKSDYWRNIHFIRPFFQTFYNDNTRSENFNNDEKQHAQIKYEGVLNKENENYLKVEPQNPENITT